MANALKKFRADNYLEIIRGEERNAPIDLILSDKSVLTIPSPVRWSDEALDLSNTDPGGALRLVLSEKDLERWKDQGATLLELNLVLEKAMGERVGESQAS